MQIDFAKSSSEIAVLFIEFQNEFTTPGGKMHDAVKGTMASTNMLKNSVAVADAARAAGCRILHAPIRFHSSFADSPNKQQGVLKGIAAGGLFVDEEWGAAFHEAMTPKKGDELVVGKKGLDSFPNTNLSSLLEGVKTLVIAGFLTSCCVESTMRSAYGECLLGTVFARCGSC